MFFVYFNLIFVIGKNSNETSAASCKSAQYQQQLQPYHGRNPCMERNLMLQSDSNEEIECQGNILLIGKSSKLSYTDKLPQQSSSETQSLVPNDYLGQQQQNHHVVSSLQQLTLRSVTPIPYVQVNFLLFFFLLNFTFVYIFLFINNYFQNVISDCNGSYNKLKQTNVQESNYTALNTNSEDYNPKRRRFSGWMHLKKILGSKKIVYQHPAYIKCEIEREDSKSNLLVNKNTTNGSQIKVVDTNVTISSSGKYVNGIVKLEKKKNDSVSLSPSGSNKNNETISLNRNRESTEKLNIDAQDMNELGGDAAAVVLRKKRASTNSTRLSLYNDRIMCSVTNGEENKRLSKDGDNSLSCSTFSVPLGIDTNNDDEQDEQHRFDLKNVTCF